MLTDDEYGRLLPCPGAGTHRGCCRTHAGRVNLLEDYLDIGGDRMSSFVVAERLGTSRRNVQRIRADLRRLTNGRLGAYKGPRDTRYPGQQNPRRQWADARISAQSSRVA